MIQLVVSVLLFFVIFFGLAFILNMLLRRTWLMSWFYPVIVIIIIDNQSTFKYITNPGEAFSQAMDRIVSITLVDMIILASGLVGTIVSGFVIKYLRKNGYQMF